MRNLEIFLDKHLCVSVGIKRKRPLHWDNGDESERKRIRLDEEAGVQEMDTD